MLKFLRFYPCVGSGGWKHRLLDARPHNFQAIVSRAASVATQQSTLKIHHILTRIGETSLPTIKESCTLEEAITHMHKCRSAALVVDKTDNIIGLFTAKDVLRFMDKCHLTSDTSDTYQNFNVEKIMKDTTRWVYCSPEDSVDRCREIMFQLKIRNMPVIEKGLVLGVVGLKHLSDATFDVAGSGKKSELLENLAGRRGLAKGQQLVPCKNIQAVLMHEYKRHITTYEPDAEAEAENLEDETMYEKALADIINTTKALPASATTIDYPPLQACVGSYGLPHPFKKHPEEGKRKGIVAPSRRHHGPGEMATDMSLCEDAFFVQSYPAAANASAQPTAPGGTSDIGTSIDLPKNGEPIQQLLYLCVADGVGSWREFGIDPRLYAFTLVENAKQVVDEFCKASRALGKDYRETSANILHPIDVLTKAWEKTNDSKHNGEHVVGSATICVAAVDLLVNQLYFSNIGDSGLLVMRRINTEIAGYMRNRESRSEKDKGNRDPLRIAYISQQQLKSFNLPFQVGFSNIPEHPGKFETPLDADTGEFADDFINLLIYFIVFNIYLNDCYEYCSIYSSATE